MDEVLRNLKVISRGKDYIRMGIKNRESSIPVYWVCFCVNFLVALVAIVPFLIQGKGYLALVGDYNAQQIPFGIFMSQSVHDGEILWNWAIDLGGNFLESFNFFDFLSPFALLSYAFPSSWFPVIMPWILMLKFAVAGLTSSLYFKRHVREQKNIIIASLLYSFSGFQCSSVMFYHFQDMVALFPLMLVGLERLIEEKKTGLFAIACTINILCNFVFFVGEVIFVVLYYVIKYMIPMMRSKSGHSLADICSSVFRCAIEGFVGILIAAVFIVPTVVNLLANNRANVHIPVRNWFSISTMDLLMLLKGFFLPADLQNQTASLLDSNWMTNAAYLPLFGMCLVIAYIISKKDWLSSFIKLCLVIAVVPVFNNAFMMFNSAAYRRWFYMLVLVMALATAKVLEKPETYKIGRAATVSFLCIAFLVVMTVLYSEDVIYSYKKYAFQILIACLGLIIVLWSIKKRNGRYLFPCTSLCCILVLGINIYGYQHTIDNTGIDFHEGELSYSQNVVSYLTEIPAALEKESFPYRYYFDEGIGYTYYNLAAAGSLPSTNSFTSVPHTGVLEFYDSLGIPRGTNTLKGPEGMQELLSVKYVVSREEQPEYKYIKEIYSSGGQVMSLYEIEDALPIGVGYQTYLLKSDFEQIPPEKRAIAMLYALVIPDDKEEMVQGILEKCTMDFTETENWRTVLKQRNAVASEDFVKGKNRFSSTIVSPQEQYAFFSVPYDKYWKATVNGTAVEILNTNGLMAIPLNQGENHIVFQYEYTPLKIGGLLSVSGVIMLAAYLIVSRKWSRNKGPHA